MDYNNTKKMASLMIIFILTVVLLSFGYGAIQLHMTKDKDYNMAIVSYKNKNYEGAAKILEELDGYKDSEKLLSELKVVITENNYNKAIELMNNEEYQEAQVIFESLGKENYKDSYKYARKCGYAIADKNAKIAAKEATESFYKKQNQEPYIGMSEADLINCSWKHDYEDCNETIYEFGTHKQYCYDGYRYVYVEDGVVTSIQK